MNERIEDSERAIGAAIKSITQEVMKLVAGLAAGPVAGAAFAALFGTKSKRDQKRLEDAIKVIGEKLERLAETAGKIDIAFFETDEWQAVAYKAFSTILREHHALKVEIIQNALIAFTVDKDPKQYDLYAWALELAENLTPLHFFALNQLCDAAYSGQAGGLQATDAEEVAKASGVPRTHAQAALDYLVSAGLAHAKMGMAMLGGLYAHKIQMNAGFYASETGLLVMNCFGAVRPKHPEPTPSPLAS